ncbi:MAG TPA: thiolase family protein [Actinomycetota bacterium]|nr:thiolase family protein [Actinomycetota bacterium]
MTEAWIVEAVRTPIGRYGGALAAVRPDDLAALVLGAAIERSAIPPADVGDVYLGCGNQAGEDNRNVARMALLLAGFPHDVPGITVNRLCGSGLEAVVQAARAVAAGEPGVHIGGGVESMTRAPWAVAKPGRAFPRGDLVAHDTALGWRFVNERMRERYGADPLGETAENLAGLYAIPRQAQDELALESHRRAVQATDTGRWGAEVVAVEAGGRRVVADEGPRRDTSLDKLAALPPVFRNNGTVTAGNSSPLSDGAAAVVVAPKAYAQARGLVPLGRLRASAVVGVEPRIMGIGPVPATARALERAGLRMGDLGLIELNEAFGAQVLAVLAEWGIDPLDERLNPNGGAIALGHPVGCSGARILVSLLHEMRRREVEIGLATMCIGVGQGIAAVVERLP